MKRIYYVALIGLLGCVSAMTAQVRSEFLLEKNWKFTREDNSEFVKPAFDDSKWQSVTVPHDWAIYGPFSAQWDGTARSLRCLCSRRASGRLSSLMER